jgi:hypothetical protein
LPLAGGDGLVGALALRRLPHIDVGEKETMRRLILDHDSWSADEQGAILNYCATDVAALTALLPAMASSIDWPRALLRGRYMAAVARMEQVGVPIDIATLEALGAEWEMVKLRLVAEIDRDFGVYEGVSFRVALFAALLARLGIDWPRTPRGHLALDGDTFKTRALAHPELEPLRQLRKTLGQLRLNALAVGRDSRNRTLLSPFRTATGRNAPSSAKLSSGRRGGCVG